MVTLNKGSKYAVKFVKDLIANDPFLNEAKPIKDALAISQDPNHTGGRKFDGDKLQYGLVPPLALRETVKVLTFGAQKYEPDNWRRVPDGHRRYFDAAQRHIWAYKEGEIIDPESGVNHMAHAICCLMFMLDLDETQVKDMITHELKKIFEK
jgi:hypothetical protein